MMRVVYLDEAGTSDNEAVIVVVGAIINADKQVIPIEEFLKSLRVKYITEDKRDNFVFHAKDIFHGNGYFDRTIWDFPTRANILKDIMSIFIDFEIPLSIGYFRDNDLSQKRATFIKHTMAYAQCFYGIEKYMGLEAKDEIAILIAEDHPTAKKYIKDMHSLFTAPKESSPIQEIYNDIMPVRHIHGTVHFADKNESALLQIVDTFAFILRRYFRGLSKVQEFIEFFMPNADNFFQDALNKDKSMVCGHSFVFLKLIEPDAILNKTSWS